MQPLDRQSQIDPDQSQKDGQGQRHLGRIRPAGPECDPKDDQNTHYCSRYRGQPVTSAIEATCEREKHRRIVHHHSLRMVGAAPQRSGFPIGQFEFHAL